MSSDEISVSVRNLTKTYRIFRHPGDRIKQAATFGLKRYHKEFAALRDVSFDIKKGETVGIIGRNGSGKSTLLQLICGILKPTSGAVTVNGRVSALLELGAGFNPEFTGRENIYFQGALMGLTKRDLDMRYDAIVSFADVGSFIDQPVRTYSTGMYVRLAFAIGINISPDLMVVDEALAVGDFAFQQKSAAFFGEFSESGRTLILVTHDVPLLRQLCSRAILLVDGKCKLDGRTADVMDYYQAMLAAPAGMSVDRHNLPSGRIQTISGTGEAVVTSIHLNDVSGHRRSRFYVGEEVSLAIEIRLNSDIERLVVGFLIRDRLGQAVYGTNTYRAEKILENVKRLSSWRYTFTFPLNLSPGSYSISTALVANDTRIERNYEYREHAVFFDVELGTRCGFAGHTWLPTTVHIHRQ